VRVRTERSAASGARVTVQGHRLDGFSREDAVVLLGALVAG